MAMSADDLYSLIMGQMNNNQPGNDYTATASANINNATNANVRNQQANLAASGMGRSGLGGVQANNAYASGNQQLSQVAAQGEQMNQQNRSDMLNQLLGLYKSQQSQPSLTSTLLGVGGTVAGSFFGPVGAVVGSQLGKLAGSALGSAGSAGAAGAANGSQLGTLV